MTQYILRLSFDYRQVTQTLAYEFLIKGNPSFDGNTRYNAEKAGPLAGTFNFQEKDEIFIDVTTNTADFKVTNCTLVSVPARMTEFISMFDHESACATIADDNWETVAPTDNETEHFVRTITPLVVATQNGQWQMSGYLSVELPAGGESPTEDGKRHQLFYFDPESSTGAGGGWPY